MKKLALVLLLCLPVCAWGQKYELFGGYSYQRIDSTGFVSNINAHGWDTSLTYNFFHPSVLGTGGTLGLEFDLAGHYAKPTITGVSVDIGEHTFMAGPRVAVKVFGVSPFAHALFGGSRITQTSTGGKTVNTDTSLAVGGGLDVSLIPHVSVRLGQVDYLRTTYRDNGHTNIRVAGGLVFKF